MKLKKILGVMLSLTLISGFSNNIKAYAVDYDYTLNQEWINHFKGSDYGEGLFIDSNDLFNDMVKTVDGGFIAVGCSYNLLEGELSEEAKPSSLIVKYNSTGQQEWAKKDNLLVSFNSVSQTSDGGYITVGYKDATGGSGDAVIAKYNSTGNQEWIKNWNGTNDNAFKSVIETIDGGFVAVGYANSNDIDGLPKDNSHKLTIVKFTSNGDKDWVSTIDCGGDDENSLKDVIENEDGSLIVVGDYTDPEGRYGDKSIVVKYTQNGIQEWIKKFGLNYSHGNDFNSILKTQDGGFVITGTYNYTSTIMRINSNGDMEWENFIDNDGLDFMINSVVETEEGNFITSGYKVVPPDNWEEIAPSMDISPLSDFWQTDAIVAKYDKNGNNLYLESWGTADRDEGFFAIESISENSFVVVGVDSNDTNADAVIVKFTNSREILKKKVSQDLNISVDTENTLEMALSTNTINFANYNGTQDFDKSLTVTVSSGLNYDLTAKLNDEIRLDTNEDVTIDKSKLKIKISEDLDYKNFTTIGDKIKLVANSSNGKNIVHNVSLKLLGDSSVKAGTYNTSITFEAEQK